ncbi:uncharacterized protein LOC106665445 [Cimex lectularius]|uniref:CUB domain-containing protein n=1 Tax=Cimex lectularius TaxID=79782 RepID=A0A8I6SHR0_CIMLE|nr:uncharacterized protein LOC106665445 [Cimex lectularius]
MERGWLQVGIALLFLGTAQPWPSPSALLSRTARVLNFFPIPVSEECKAENGRRTGICLNAYECRITSGTPHGPCALGFGVCCVFTATCGAVVENNIVYFINPGFPGLTQGSQECTLLIKKLAPEVTQFRLDFIHFNLGQPNRKTGVCDSDRFRVTGGSSHDINICGQNSGQHLYFDVENIKDPVKISMNLSKSDLYRIWEIKITQIEFNSRAPAGCDQYFLGEKGVIQTMNYAINGRHLADQDYNICIRQEEKMCSIVYEPCDDNSFRIGPSYSQDDEGSGSGPISNSIRDSSPDLCEDKIVMACDTEDFISPVGSPGLCDLLRCGNTFCSGIEGPCRIETSTKPFNIRVKFGPGSREESPEDNIGMCLKYEQQPCT